MTNKMRYLINAKNAELQGLRFSISFLQVKNELSAKVTYFSTKLQTFGKKRLKAL